MIKKIMNFLSENWILLVILVALIYKLVEYQKDINAYREKVKIYNEKISNLEDKILKDLQLIETLSKKETIYIKETDVIKEETDKKIKLVDTMSTSDLQAFFSKRYHFN